MTITLSTYGLRAVVTGPASKGTKIVQEFAQATLEGHTSFTPDGYAIWLDELFDRLVEWDPLRRKEFLSIVVNVRLEPDGGPGPHTPAGDRDRFFFEAEEKLLSWLAR